MKIPTIILLSILKVSIHAAGCTYNYSTLGADWGTAAVCTSSTNVCANTSLKQSPINVQRTTVSYPSSTAKTKIQCDYDTKGGLWIVNVGETQKVTIDGGSITYNNVKYNLAQYHWHQPSEHTFDGMHYDAELHLVHTTTDTSATDPYFVIAIYFQLGPENSWLKKNKYSYASDYTNGGAKLNHKINVWDIIKSATTDGVYEYTGSFTTPPCTEGVTFLLTRTPQTLSMAQWTAFAASVPAVTFNYSTPIGNNRTPQSINSRTVYYKY